MDCIIGSRQVCRRAWARKSFVVVGVEEYHSCGAVATGVKRLRSTNQTPPSVVRPLHPVFTQPPHKSTVVKVVVPLVDAYTSESVTRVPIHIRCFCFTIDTGHSGVLGHSTSRPGRHCADQFFIWASIALGYCVEGGLHPFTYNEIDDR